MNFWSVRNVQKYYISINSYPSSNKKILSHVALRASGWSHLKFITQLCEDVMYTKQHRDALALFQRAIVDSSKLKEFADDNFKFYKNGRKFSKWVENTAGKGEIARFEQFLLFPQCFRKICTADT